MIRHLHLILLASVGMAGLLTVAAQEKKTAKPLRALLICGGCCHDYEKQSEILRTGIQARANVQVDIMRADDKSTKPTFPLYEKADWANGYDVIIHDECAAGVKDLAFVKNVINAHKTVPAVNLHCAMHSFRTGTDDWFKFIGLQSTGHGPQEPIDINFTDGEHPVTETLSNWTTIKEELYNNVNVFDAKPLAMGKQLVKNKDGSTRTDEAIVVWTNETQGARSFSTTLGHNNDTVGDARYLDLITRGLLWSMDKLTPEYLVPYQGPEGKTTILPPTPQDETKKKQSAAPPQPSKDGTPVVISASSEESDKGNYIWMAADGKSDTRWCASSSELPQWLQLDLEKAYKVSGVKMEWESKGGNYRHKVEGSSDGKVWSVLADASANKNRGVDEHTFAPAEVRYIKVSVIGTHGGWASIREISLKGEGIKSLSPKLSAEQLAKASEVDYAKEGNVEPKIIKLTPEQETEILKDVKVADGFEVTLFANSAAANYPVYVAAAPNGDLYVSSDGNGSLGRNPKRGRIIRLRDNDNDGKADETKVFCEVDSPRGLVWDKDRLYVVHPPDVSVFIDKDGDGKSDEQKVLVKGIAFGFKDRPADHTTNGLSLGMDGKLYIAGGDFGFMDAVGADGKHLQHRNGGVIRLNPDGSDLEIYATGTRNILEVAISPSMEIFARDNTNDGGGWNVRFHHFPGFTDHGYPRLYMNFSDEIVQPLADYGGGSGCGAVYIDEPGFGKWNNAPFTVDWGTNALWHHEVKPKGATFEETRKPEPFVKMTRPTDADVDGMGNLYVASWKGATFNWAGADVGYIVRVRPKDFKADALPDFAKASDDELIKLLETPSYRRRLEAQRELQRRENPAAQNYLAKIAQQQTPQRAAIDRIKSIVEEKKVSDYPEIAKLTGDSDTVVSHVAVNALAELKDSKVIFAELDKGESKKEPLLRALAKIHDVSTVDGLIERLNKSSDTTVRQGILAALSRLYHHEGVWKGDSWGTRPDTRGPYYQPEPWEQTEKIAAILKEALAKGSPEESAFLIKEMNRNRIQSNDALNRILALAKQDSKLVPEAVSQLAQSEEIPAEGIPFLIDAARRPLEDTSVLPAVRSQAIVALTKTDSADGWKAALEGMSIMSKIHNEMQDIYKAREAARKTFLEAPKLENHHQFMEAEIEKLDSPTNYWAYAAVLNLSARKTGSPESREQAGKALDKAWQDPKHRRMILRVVADLKHNPYADKVLAALDDSDKDVVKAAQHAVRAMKLEKKTAASGPVVGTLKPADAIAMVLKTKGDVGLGEQVYARATCVACHTVRQDEAQKGPYLGNIAQTYKRAELAESILDPNKSIAQGFATNLIVTNKGETQMGFVTFESADKVTIRNIAAQEFTFATKDIVNREKPPMSMMPPGLASGLTMREFASLLDYLEALAKK